VRPARSAPYTGLVSFRKRLLGEEEKAMANNPADNNLPNRSRVMFGRTTLFSNAQIINEDNIIQELTDALTGHAQNMNEIDYLYNYRKGKQPILSRVKDTRAEICAKIVVNLADYIVSFKAGYLMGSPVQYVTREQEDANDDIALVNRFMNYECKSKKDFELASWFYTCGVAYRLIEPNSEYDRKNPKKASPFKTYVLDPRNTFVVYSTEPSHRPLYAVNYVQTKENGKSYTVYTDTMVFKIEDLGVAMKLVGIPAYHYCGKIPIIEYNSNMLKMGAFENVITLLDALNLTQSDRQDGIEQFIQALMMFKGVDINDDDYKTLREEGAIKVPPDGDIKYIISELNQTQTQTLIDDMTKQILLICGVPLQSDSGTSDSSNNGAMIIKNGWQQAEAKAQESEKYFEEPERQFLDIAVRIAKTFGALGDLYTSNMDIRFTRRNYEDIQAKAQVLVTMLGCEKIHPLYAFEYCGMFIDPNLAYEESKAYVEELERKQAEELAKAVEESPDNDITAQESA